MSSNRCANCRREMMRYLGEDEAQMQGLGYFGQVYLGVDGHLYEWVEGVDPQGESIGFWQGLSQPEPPMLDGLGALYEAPDGTVYRVEGLADEDQAQPDAEASEQSEQPAQSAAAKATGPKGRGRPGEIRLGPDHRRYRWI